VKRVLLLLCKGAEVYEAAAFYDVLGWSGDCGGEPVEVVTVGRTPEVTCTFGLRIVPDRLLADVDPSRFDALAVPGGFEAFGYYEDAYSDQVGELIRLFEGAGRTVASICVGALPLAKSGILAGRTATTYHRMDGLRRRQLADFDVEVLDEPVVRDGPVITSTSPATAMGVAFALLAELTGAENADRVRREMGFGE
jgi:4-methyl-5(b-hydroxyethyl)-thiazole monophosphate biosynthesis